MQKDAQRPINNFDTSTPLFPKSKTLDQGNQYESSILQMS